MINFMPLHLYTNYIRSVPNSQRSVSSVSEGRTAVPPLAVRSAVLAPLTLRDAALRPHDSELPQPCCPFYLPGPQKDQ